MVVAEDPRECLIGVQDHSAVMNHDAFESQVRQAAETLFAVAESGDMPAQGVHKTDDRGDRQPDKPDLGYPECERRTREVDGYWVAGIFQQGLR